MRGEDVQIDVLSFQLEIWRTGRNVTICKSRVGNIDRKERITREDGGYYTEM